MQTERSVHIPFRFTKFRLIVTAGSALMTKKQEKTMAKALNWKTAAVSLKKAFERKNFLPVDVAKASLAQIYEA